MTEPGAPTAGAPIPEPGQPDPAPPALEDAPLAAARASASAVEHAPALPVGDAQAPAVEDAQAPALEDAPQSVDEPHASYLLLGVVTFLAAASDLVTKHWAKVNLAGYDAKAGGAKRYTVWPDHFDFVFAQNPGGAWSFLRGLPEYIRRPFFLFISAAAIVFIVAIYRKVRPDQHAMKWGLPLALGGAVGNLVDRIRYGYVIDFIDFYVTRGANEHHWPTFNVADVWICVGVGLMAIDMIGGARRGIMEERAQAAEQAVSPPPAAPAAGLPEPPG